MKWSDKENRAICLAYAAMLHMEQMGKKFNKSAVRRGTLKLLDNRSNGSYEMKCQNISHCLASHSLPYVIGYKPLSASQKSLCKVAVSMCDEMDTPTAELVIANLMETGKLPSKVKS